MSQAEPTTTTCNCRAPDTSATSTSSSGEPRGMRKNNCVVCGADLVYRTRATQPLPQARDGGCGARVNDHDEATGGGARCVVCGGVFDDVMVTCGRGHFVCDSCHSADAVHAILAVCAESDTSDPLSLAYSLLEFPSVCMHGPEHHFLVPAVLITAYHNTLGSPREKKLADLKAAKQRSSEVPGGWCGFCGCCGGAVGVGIFLSVVQNATPMSTSEWACSNQGTGVALGSLSSIGGPRCCARATFNGVIVGQHFAAAKLGVTFTKPNNIVCNVFKNNKQCLGVKCPFHPRGSPESRSGYTQNLQASCGLVNLLW
ncbi:SAM-dependent methyltransferase [Pelomyxa schiedti]|nr:SAM-dependent methyltransferase [Pelomyxa schiedti]